jgi:hypothetical protein
MKKNSLLKIAFVVTLCIAATSSVSFASAYSGATCIGGTTTGTSFSASNKVTVFGISNGSSSTTYDGTTYSIRSKHSAGDKVIAAAAGDSKLYFQVTTVGDSTLLSGAATTDNYTSTTAWTSM